MNETIERTPKGWKTLQAISVIVMCFALLDLLASLTTDEAIIETKGAWLMILGGCGYFGVRVATWWRYG